MRWIIQSGKSCTSMPMSTWQDNDGIGIQQPPKHMAVSAAASYCSGMAEQAAIVTLWDKFLVGQRDLSVTFDACCHIVKQHPTVTLQIEVLSSAQRASTSAG